MDVCSFLCIQYYGMKTKTFQITQNKECCELYIKKISFLSEQRRLNHVINTESIKHFILFMTSKKLMISLISFLTSYAKFCFLWVKLVSYQKVPSYSTMMLWILSVYNVIFIGRGTQKMYFWNIKKFFNKKLFFVSLRQKQRVVMKLFLNMEFCLF